MAALMEPFALAKVVGESALVGVSRGEKDNQVIITSKTGFINVYQLSDQKLVSSWSLRHGIQITCPTVWSSTKQEYLCVQNRQELKFWTPETVNFDKAKKKHIGAEVESVLVETGFHPVVVCRNGRVDFQANIKDSCKTGVLSEGEAIVWCHSYVSTANLNVVILSQTQSKELNIHRHTYLADAECWQLKTSSIRRSSTDLVSCCLSKKTDPSLLTLWRNGQLLETSLSNLVNFENSHEVAVLPEVQANTRITSLDHTHLSLAGIVKDGKFGLGIYNVKFQALQNWRPLPENVVTKPNLYSHWGHLFLACNKTLYAFPFECQASTVARLLGQRDKVKETVTPVTPGAVSWTTDKNTKVKDSKKSGEDKKIEELFTSLCDEQQKKTKKEFCSDFNKLMNLVLKSSNSHWLYSSHMSLLTHTLLTMTTFWPRSQIHKLISHKLISNSDQTAVFDVLTSRGEIHLIHECLCTMPDVDEISLIKSLQCYLDMPDDDFVDKCGGIVIFGSLLPDSDEDVKLPVSNTKAHLLNTLLNLPFNDVFLVESLHKLSFKNVLILLEYLYQLLRTLPISGRREGDSDRLPLIGKVTDWLGLLIDAHMTQLIVSPDARMLLGNLHETVTEQVEFCNQLSTLEAALVQLKMKCVPLNQQKVGSYCIEVLHIR